MTQHNAHDGHPGSASSGKGISPIALQKHLKGTSYPASKQDLVTRARTNQAPDDLLARIRMLPEHIYATPAEVMRAFGQTH
ncbi:MAG TPA: DUF2795 domain-containing protein [Ktedonobacterales bacterium]|jgi:hypothetical protein